MYTEKGKKTAVQKGDIIYIHKTNNTINIITRPNNRLFWGWDNGPKEDKIYLGEVIGGLSYACYNIARCIACAAGKDIKVVKGMKDYFAFEIK